MLPTLSVLVGLAHLGLGLSISSTLPNGYSSLGCYTDYTQGTRTFAGASYTNTTGMTEETCISFCAGKSFIYAGVEYGQECYCGNTFLGGSTNASQSDCNMACTGNKAEVCGAGYRLNVFWSGQNAPPPPITNPGVNGWGSQGCYSDNVNSRTLSQGVAVPGGANNMTVALCTTACKNAGYTLAGLEYSSECYCGNAYGTGGAPITNGCNMICNGNGSEYCGGSNALNVYKFGASSSTTLATSTKAATQSVTTVAGVSSPNPTSTPVSSSASSSAAQPTTSTSAAQQTTSTSAAQPTTSTSAAQPTTSTSAAAQTSTTAAASTSATTTSTSVPNKAATPTTTSSSSAAATTSAAGSSTATSVPPTIIPGSSAASDGIATLTSTSATSTTSAAFATNAGVPKGWTYKGCWVDNAHGRIFITQIAQNNTLTVESCTNACSAAGYSIAGMEYSTQCFCGNQIIQGGALASQDSQCAMTCGGNSKEICGGPNLLSVWSNSTVVALPVPSPQNSSLPGSWSYAGCVTDTAGGTRALPYQIILPANNSAATCISQCSAFGYPYGGMEYGDECYCGDASDLANAGSKSAPESDCNMPCPGNGSFVCGAGNRISLYKWSGTPLYSFNYPSGNNAGSYEYFMPGVVVPLITVPGINGKITFVEKYGTSEFGNSTGAYELDPSLAGNFSAAWRTMTGIKTDVFCSAGLILPDKGARQINVGGWSEISTFGVRFYTPNGKLGTNSTNMWEENANEVALQAGRWYPSAMIMANGSILVVGGEGGSNGVPTPSLELLPKAGGTLYCDWLERTDPNNLYPYLSVLPSGGIFVAYYNEARILDPVSLQTKSVLPMIPGSVNNAGSGRTYPFEGTSVLLPQKAPYSDPLTVLICGGSNAGLAVALDNCVSIQPDVPNANWTLERMPSKRVMSCMVALPDGTYLILNGAHQGVAGFGLATDPNYNAVLYDPSKPVGARMSIMANTTIARLYHSEAVLMDDGRVLVSGSDPQDNTHPEELRVEVFNPPYILNGGARPTLNVSNNDWAYGGSYSVTVNIPSGNVAGAKISLLGAVASTHGNSMGQRTIFPAVSCSGTTCRVTAPPNANVSPPGWFQVFVLDNGVPSTAKWVRIGGDPGSLGSWPNYPDFTRPGS